MRGSTCQALHLCAALGLALLAAGCVAPSEEAPAGDWGDFGRADAAGGLVGDAVIRFRAGGDVMMGTDYPPPGALPPNDGQDLFADVAEWLTDATVTFVNLEGPLCDGGTTDKCTAGSTSCYAFRTPTRYGRYVAGAGVDVASLANNHALDFGEACRGQTEATLDALGIAHSGRPGTVASLDRGGVRIGLVAFHTASHSNNVLDIPAASELVRQVAASHDLVVVSFHGGAEGAGALHVPAGAEYFQGSDRGDLRRFSHAVVDAGADLVIGHGPHVPRAMEVYGGRLVAYSLGNFATYGRFNLSGEQGVSLVLEAQLAADGRFVAGAILPVRLVDGGFPVQDDSGRVVPLVRSLTESDFPSTGVVVGADGTIFPRQAQ